MRNAIFFLAASLCLVACDNDHPTSPQASRQSSIASNEQLRNGDYKAAGKPAPGPVFTATVVKSAGAKFGITGNNFGYPMVGTITATCPDGTTLTGGGYYKENSTPEKLNVLSSEPVGSSWSVHVRFADDGLPSDQATIYVSAICIQ